MKKDYQLQQELEQALAGNSHLMHGEAFSSLESTNDFTAIKEKQGAPSGSVVITALQVKGRGRLMRTWDMVEGDIALSVLLRAPHLHKNLALLAMVPALAVIDALASFGINPRIKWPNDLIIASKEDDPLLNYFLHFRKVGGILVENIFCEGKLSACIFGIGLNLMPNASRMYSVPHSASLSEYVPGLDRSKCLIEILRAVDRYVMAMSNASFEEQVLSHYINHCETIGKKVVIQQSGKPLIGIASHINKDGSLSVYDGHEQNIVFAGDVSCVR